MLPEQSKLAWCIVVTIFHIVAILSTVIRLWHRTRNRQLWWDDYVAIIPLLLDCVYLCVLWVAVYNGDYLRYAHGSYDNTFSSFYFGFLLNLIILWSARISLALSLARIFPPGHFARKLSFLLSALYISIFLTLNGLVIGLCQGENLPWYKIDPNNCLRGTQHTPPPGMFGLISDLVADLLLFIAPTLALRKVRLPNTELRLILAAFSASILTLLSTVVFAVFWYSPLDLGPDVILLRIVIAQIETTVSLIVCNLLMVTMFVYRLFRRIPSTSSTTSEKPKFVHPPPPPPPIPPCPEGLTTFTQFPSNAYHTTDQPTHLTLTEIEDCSGESLGSLRDFEGGEISLQTESAPAIGQRAFSVKSQDFRSVP